MDVVIVIVIIWIVLSSIVKGIKNAVGSNPQNRNRTPYAPQRTQPNRPRPIPPLTPTARPGTGVPDMRDLMTMLGGASGNARPQPDMEGVSTESNGPSGSLTGPSMMEGSPNMIDGPGMMDGSRSMMDGSQPMIDATQSDYEGATLPGELSADAVAVLPRSEDPASAPLPPAFQPKRYDPAAMRDAVVWAEILKKPKAMRRVAR